MSPASPETPFDVRRRRLLELQARIRAVRRAQLLSMIRCTLCVRVNEGDPEPGTLEARRIERLAIPDARLLGWYPLPASRAGGGRFLIYGEESATNRDLAAALLPLQDLAETAAAHLRAAHVDFGEVPGTLCGWLWILYVIAWKFPSSERPLGYSISTGILSDSLPDEFAKRMSHVEVVGGPSIFNATGFRWGEWGEHRTEAQACCELHELSADLLDASCAALDAIVHLADRRLALSRKLSERSAADWTAEQSARVDPKPEGLPGSVEEVSGDGRSNETSAPGSRTMPPGFDDGAEVWIPAKSAAELTEKLGRKVGLTTLRRKADRGHFRSRPAPPGTKTRYEIDKVTFLMWHTKEFGTQSVKQ